MSRSCHLKILITSTESRTNFKEADQNHAKGDRLKNMDEHKALSGQQLMDLTIMDLRIRSVQIALGHTHQISAEQLAKNVMDATKSGIIFEGAQTTRKVGQILLKTKILQVFMLLKLTKLPQLLLEFMIYKEENMENLKLFGYRC